MILDIRSSFLYLLHITENTALPCLWEFDHRHEMLMMADIQDLFMTQTAFPAFTLEMLFHVDCAPLSQNHRQTI